MSERVSIRKHTPKPWIVTKERSHPHSKTNVGSAVYGSVASCYGCRPSPEENAANARLIAASPEMLEALETLVSYWNQDEDLSCEDALAAAEIAIRKATGNRP